MRGAFKMPPEVQSEMNTQTVHQVLSRTGWLSSQPLGFQARFLEASEIRSLPPNSTVYGLDDPPGGVYGIADGFVDVLAAPGPFSARLVHVASAGWWVGEAAAATLTTRRVELRSRTQITVAYIAAWKLDRMAECDPTIWRNLASLTVRHLDSAMLYAASFASADLKLRVLVTLMRIIGPALDRGGSMELPIGQAELAELTGLSRNTITRLLSKLSDDGYLKRNYGSVTVNVNRLKSILHTASPSNPL
jgi:CRP/FNR family cyclic AMP-dependent transcriptional regulator